MYTLRILDSAVRDLRKLDANQGRRIVERLQWLADNLDGIRPEPLTGDLSGLYKFRVGDYRVIYEIARQEQRILIHTVGHRRDVYKRR